MLKFDVTKTLTLVQNKTMGPINQVIFKNEVCGKSTDSDPCIFLINVKNQVGKFIKKIYQCIRTNY